MNLLLISETAIIEQIFSLVCKKLNIELNITQSTDVEDNYDLIIVDQSFIDDKFNIIKQFTKKLGAISSEELPFDKSRDFVIPRPFLPTKLQDILNEQLSFIKEDEKNKNIEDNKTSSNYSDEYPEDEEVTIPVTNYVDSLAEDVYLDIEESNDESIVELATLKEGGVLDHSELSKINDILKDEQIQNEIIIEQEDWKDISDIIDDALDEVKEYEFDISDVNKNEDSFNLILNQYNIEELKPLLEKCNQEIIDKLSAGESVDIKLSLKEKS